MQRHIFISCTRRITVGKSFLKWTYSSPRLLAKAIRFSFVGFLSGVVFSLTTALLVSGLGVEAIVSSILGYCISVPVSFLGHRQFSFHSKGNWIADTIRFAFVQMCNIALTAGAMYVTVEQFRSQYYWGIMAAIALIPIVNFGVANLWVFRNQAHG